MRKPIFEELSSESYMERNTIPGDLILRLEPFVRKKNERFDYENRRFEANQFGEICAESKPLD
jgi:hypothetical protein